MSQNNDATHHTKKNNISTIFLNHQIGPAFLRYFPDAIWINCNGVLICDIICFAVLFSKPGQLPNRYIFCTAEENGWFSSIYGIILLIGKTWPPDHQPAMAIRNFFAMFLHNAKTFSLTVHIVDSNANQKNYTLLSNMSTELENTSNQITEMNND